MCRGQQTANTGLLLTRPHSAENMCMEPPWPRQMPVFFPNSSAMMLRAGTPLLSACTWSRYVLRSCKANERGIQYFAFVCHSVRHVASRPRLHDEPYLPAFARTLPIRDKQGELLLPFKVAPRATNAHTSHLQM